MKLEIIKKESEAIDDRISVPVPVNMKLKLDSLKNKRKIDVNKMVRNFFKELIEKAESEDQSA